MNNTPDNNTNIPAGSNKRSSPLLKVLPIAVLAAVLVYFAAQVYNYFADPMTITLVYEAQAEDVISMEGWLVRTEEPLPGQTGTVSRAVQEGQRVAAGETVATVYSDDSALQTVSRIETLELQLQQLQFALTSYLDPDAALKLDTSITGHPDPAPDAERRGLCRGGERSGRAEGRRAEAGPRELYVTGGHTGPDQVGGE